MITSMKKKHQEILQKIQEYEIFTKDQILISEDFEVTMLDDDEVEEILSSAVFFQVIPGKIYFFLMDSIFLCIKSELLARKDLSKAERLEDIKCISFEEFIEIVPKDVAKKYLYHLDFFQEHLEVIDI